MKKKIKITEGLAVVLEGRIKAFREKFGCEPGPGDPIFFDPDADQPQIHARDRSHKRSPSLQRLVLSCYLLPKL